LDHSHSHSEPKNRYNSKEKLSATSVDENLKIVNIWSKQYSIPDLEVLLDAYGGLAENGREYGGYIFALRSRRKIFQIQES
jgi:hypothetical protein